ncbi:hypothetical protein D9V84_08495 [Bacteroidetes/Chlorobi group bacterium Naka2016]|nr:MAG: hypothetical protein D9V84_08495 [Bacteroidetes/Chlorobi group bacterium Naka2016]
MFAATAKTIVGDCNSSDASKHFKTKTYIDLDGDKKWDYLIVRWCDDKITKTPLKIVYSSGTGELNPADLPIHQLEQIGFEEGTSDSRFTFLLREIFNGPILAVERKEFANDTCFIYVLENIYFTRLDDEMQKMYPLGVFDSENRLYVNEVFLKEPQKVIISLQYENGEIIQKKEFEGIKGWNILFFKFPEFIGNGKYYLRLETKTSEFGSITPIILK